MVRFSNHVRKGICYFLNHDSDAYITIDQAPNVPNGTRKMVLCVFYQRDVPLERSYN